MSDLRKVCSLDQLREGLPYPITVDDEDIVIILSQGRVYAMQDRCSHQDFPLSQGQVRGDIIKCRAHGAEFCMKDGKALCAPAFAPVPVFTVKVEDGNVYIDLG